MVDAGINHLVDAKNPTHGRLDGRTRPPEDGCVSDMGATMTSTKVQSPEARAAQRAKDFTGLMWHALVFVLLNGALWALDLSQGGNLWAFWVTIFTGLALVFHAAWYFLERGRMQGRRYEKFLEQEQRRNAS
jgi:hypothetical protein